MMRFALYLLIAAGCWAAACNNTSNPAPALTSGPARQDSTLIEADAIDLLQTLQGKWQSEEDSSYQIEITGNKMKHFNAGKVSMEAQVEIDANCRSVACTADSLETTSGWCFVEKGQFDAQCNLILKCDKQILQYRALGAASPGLSFKKK